MSHSTTTVMRDERTLTTENASYRWAYLVLSFGLLVATAYRAFARNDAAWDLLALVVLGGVVATAYQGVHRVLTRRWVWVTVSGMLLAAVLAGLIVAVR